MCISIFYQQKMEQFYNVLADVIFLKNCYVRWDRGVEEDVLYPELLLFEETVSNEVYDSQLEALLGYMVERGYKIVMNFYAPDIVLGNVAVKIHDRWFAFGECINQGARESQEGQYVTEIWPLKYVLPQLRQMEVKPRYTIPIHPQAQQTTIHKSYEGLRKSERMRNNLR